MSDRIEQLLVQLAESQAKPQKQVDSNAKAIEALTNHSNEGIANVLHNINEQNQTTSESRADTALLSEKVSQTSEQVEQTSASVATLGQEIAEIFRRGREANTALMTNIVEAMDQRDSEVREQQAITERKLQELIAASEEDRAEAERQRTAFTETVQSLVSQISGRLNEIAKSIERLWERINAA